MRRDPEDLVGSSDRAARVEGHRVIEAVTLDVRPNGVRRLLDADCDDRQAFASMLIEDGTQVRCLLLARRAPTCPEDDPDRAPSQVSEADWPPIQITNVDVLAAILPGESRCGCSNLQPLGTERQRVEGCRRVEGSVQPAAGIRAHQRASCDDANDDCSDDDVQPDQPTEPERADSPFNLAWNGSCGGFAAFLSGQRSASVGKLRACRRIGDEP